MTDITKLMELKDQIDAAQKQIDELENKASDLRSTLAKRCTHPTTVKREHYSSGGYDYRSSSTTWDECTICGKHLNSKTREGSFG